MHSSVGVFEQELPGVETVKSDDEEDRHRQLPLCPAFSGGHDHVLLLPCSHPMCAHCIAAAQGTRSGRSTGQSGGQRTVTPAACLVPCQYCQCPVELPCRTWSSATSCLPKHPSLLGLGSLGLQRQSEDQSHVQHVQVEIHKVRRAVCRDLNTCGDARRDAL